MTHQDAMNIAATAWEQVKPEDDPPFEQCAQDHKFRLAYKVENVAKGGNPDDDFDRAVHAILNPQPEAAINTQPGPVAAKQPKAKAKAKK